MQDNIHRKHRERMKKNFIRNGFGNTAPHNVLEFILFFSIPVKDTNELAHRLIKYFGSLAGVFEASYEDLLKVEGIGPHSATLILTYLQAFKAYEEDRESNIKTISDRKEAYDFLRAKFVGETEEQIVVLILDNKDKVLSCDVVAKGTVQAVDISTRKVVEYVLRHKGSSVIVAHNHPSGIASASPADIATTKQLQQTLTALGVRLLDHVIFSGNNWVSMKDAGVVR